MRVTAGLGKSSCHLRNLGIMTVIKEHKAQIVTRFAPSPSGFLHLGHVYAALHARKVADAAGGAMRLRIDDIDHTRCKPVFKEAILEDLTWLGIAHDGPLRIQSEQLDDYQQALASLQNRGLVYPCWLSRAALNALLDAPHQPVQATDKLESADRRRQHIREGREPAWRLRINEALEEAGSLSLEDSRFGRHHLDPEDPAMAILREDVVIARRDIGTSYHLSVVIDDAAQGVTLATRGLDLWPVAPLHRLLQQLLGLPETRFCHHPLILDSDGNRLAKRNHGLAIAQLRQQGMSPRQVLDRLAAAKLQSTLDTCSPAGS